MCSPRLVRRMMKTQRGSQYAPFKTLKRSGLVVSPILVA
jgi:hypothetical protein